MLLTFINFKLWTTIYLFGREVVWLLDNPLLSFPDLIQPLLWALQTSAVCPSQTYFLHVCPCGQSLAKCVSPLQVKQLDIAFTLALGNLLKLLHLLAVWPKLLYLIHLQGGPLAPEVDLSFTERIALSSSSEISIACDRRMESPLLRTMV
jgi:hypothetical protein